MKFIFVRPFCHAFLQLLLFLPVMISCRNSRPPQHGLSPEEALSTFELAPGFQIELVASEPLISDPVAMEIDEYGRMYVVEMHGYPLDKTGSGKIKLLNDTDGDGQMDKSIVFAEGLVLPTGIMRWKKGVMVTDPPNVMYFEDSDGDGKADIRDTLLTGFALSNPQHNVNNPLLGIDNWIYIGHEPAVTPKVYEKEFGDRGTDVYYTAQKDSPRLPDNALGRSIRFRPDRMQLETLSGNTQFGHSFDTWGRHLLVSNANHIMHEVIADAYLRRNPELLVSNATQSISDHGDAADVYPITKNPDHQLLTDIGVFTSACGLTFYQGGLFPSPFDSVSFVAEPVSNIVHADIVRDKGASFSASRLYDHTEFLASTDAWFRPVNMYTGPDGALYICDYYRQIIEHPEWMADEVVKSGALYNGMDQGRIYRITPKGTPHASWAAGLKLGDATDAQLVEKLADPNIWWRRNAQRLLTDRKAKEAIPTLIQTTGNTQSPAGRLHALWTLEGLDELRPEHIIKALHDTIAGIRENAIRLSEPFLTTSPELVNKLYPLQNDSNAKVRFQLACSLGYINTAEAAEARKNILFRDINDPWIQIAALSAKPAFQSNLLTTVLTRFKDDVPAYTSLVEHLSAMSAAGGDAAVISSLMRKALQTKAGNNAGWQAAVLKGLARGMRNKKDYAPFEKEQELLLQSAFTHPSPDIRNAGLQLLQVMGLPKGEQTKTRLERSARTAADQRGPIEERLEAIQFLSLGDPSHNADLLKSLISPTEPTAIQLAALRTLSAIPGTMISHYLLEHWTSLTPALRDAGINSFMRGDDRITLLLDAIEADKIDPSVIGWPRSVALMAQGNETLRKRSRALLSKQEGERSAIIKAYLPALSLKSNADSGKMVYQKNCAICHQVGGAYGVAFGPDLGTIRNRRPESVMNDILNPGLSIADGYDIWLLQLTSGETVQGLIETETPTAITLNNYGGQKTTIARHDIQSLKALGMSAMPAGLEKQITPQQMSNLLAFIQQAK